MIDPRTKKKFGRLGPAPSRPPIRDPHYQRGVIYRVHNGDAPATPHEFRIERQPLGRFEPQDALTAALVGVIGGVVGASAGAWFAWQHAPLGFAVGFAAGAYYVLSVNEGQLSIVTEIVTPMVDTVRDIADDGQLNGSVEPAEIAALLNRSAHVFRQTWPAKPTKRQLVRGNTDGAMPTAPLTNHEYMKLAAYLTRAGYVDGDKYTAAGREWSKERFGE